MGSNISVAAEKENRQTERHRQNSDRQADRQDSQIDRQTPLYLAPQILDGIEMRIRMRQTPEPDRRPLVSFNLPVNVME